MIIDYILQFFTVVILYITEIIDKVSEFQDYIFEFIL